MLRLKQRVFAQAGGFAVQHVVTFAQGFAQLRVGGERVNAAVNVHGRVVFYSAAVGGGDLVISVAVGLQDLDHRMEQGGALRVAEGAQGGACLLAGEGETRFQVQPRGIHAAQLGAEHGVEQSTACARADVPLAAEVVGEFVAHETAFRKYGESKRGEYKGVKIQRVNSICP